MVSADWGISAIVEDIRSKNNDCKSRELKVNTMDEKLISVLVPTFNEEGNINICYGRVKYVFDEYLPNYNWHILFIDNFSTDKTRTEILELCGKDKRIQAIFNGKNYGYARSSYYGLTVSEGNATVLLHADLQDPPEVIPDMVRKWESGHKVVCGQKIKNEESFIVEATRKAYYHLLDRINEYGHIEQYNGFGLYDHSFIEILASIEDPLPYLRGMVAELAPDVALVPYNHMRRVKGKSKFSFMKLLDYSLMGITSTSKMAMRLASILGFVMVIACLIIALITFIVKLTHWDTYPVGMAVTIIGIFFIGAVQLMFIGILGEYVTNMNIRIMKRPLVVEQKRINFKNNEEQGGKA